MALLILTLTEVSGDHAPALLSLQRHYLYIPASEEGEKEEKTVFIPVCFSRHKRLMNHTYGPLQVKRVSECTISRAQTASEDKHVEVTTRRNLDKSQESDRRINGSRCAEGGQTETAVGRGWIECKRSNNASLDPWQFCITIM